jgi:hypothetical protein
MSADHVAAIMRHLESALEMCRARNADPAEWSELEAELRPHLNALEQIARRGALDTAGAECLRGTMSSFVAYREQAHRAPRGRRY